MLNVRGIFLVVKYINELGSTRPLRRADVAAFKAFVAPIELSQKLWSQNVHTLDRLDFAVNAGFGLAISPSAI